jgi:hypothetical protein
MPSPCPVSCVGVGEANAGNATNYACRFPAMISDWRAQFNNFHLNFYFVLLAAYAAQHTASDRTGRDERCRCGWGVELTV